MPSGKLYCKRDRVRPDTVNGAELATVNAADLALLSLSLIVLEILSLQEASQNFYRISYHTLYIQGRKYFMLINWYMYINIEYNQTVPFYSNLLQV